MSLLGSAVSVTGPEAFASLDIEVVSLIRISSLPLGLLFQFLLELIRGKLPILNSPINGINDLILPLLHGLVHSDSIEHHFWAFAANGCFFQGAASQLPVLLELLDRHLQHLRAVFKAVFGCGFWRQVLGKIVGKPQQILQL